MKITLERVKMKKDQLKETEFISAAGAVYAWMCAADGVITVNESEGFAKYLNTLPYVNDITHEDFVSSYEEISLAFENNFEDGYNRALVRIEALRIDKEAARALVKVARQALVADEKLAEVEENVLKELCSILEIPEDSQF